MSKTGHELRGDDCSTSLRVPGRVFLPAALVSTLLFTLATFAVHAQVGNAQQLEVTFVNRTGATIFYLYASPVTSDNWGDDILGARVLGAGDSYRFVLRGRSVRYDIRAVDSGENEYIIWNWNFAADPAVDISRTDFVGIRDIGSPDAFGWVSIVNRTNYTIEQLYIVPAGTADWRESEQLLSRNQQIYDGEDYRAEVDVDRGFLVDIILVDEDGDRYIKRAVNLELVSEVVYTLDDLFWQ